MHHARPIVAAAVLLLVGAACSTARTEVVKAGDAGVARIEQRPAHVSPPEDADEARSMLEGALVALDDGNGARAASLLAAILRSDQLTDRGRANVYWLSAEALRRVGDEAREADALAGFLVAAEVVMPDDDLEKRAVQARAWLIARKLKTDPALGKSQAQAIAIPDARVASALVQALGCGRDGHGRFIEQMVEAAVDPGLIQRRASCDDGSATLELWFDVATAPASSGL